MVSLAQKVILETGEDRKQTLVYVIVRDVLLQIVICSLQEKIQNEFSCKKYGKSGFSMLQGQIFNECGLTAKPDLTCSLVILQNSKTDLVSW